MRPITVADLPELFDLHRRVQVHDAIPIVTPWEEFEEIKDSPNVDLATDTTMVVRDGQAIGYGRVWHRPAGDADHARAFAIGEVDPKFRREGVGTRIFQWTLDRARERLATSPAPQDRFIRTFAYDFETDAIALYERHGLKPVRYFAELLRPLDDAISVPPTAGIEIVPWDEARSDEVRRLFNLAFRDHWGSTPVDEQSWEHEISGVGSRIDVSYLALVGDQVVGASRNAHYPTDRELTGRLDGWIGTLGTHPQWRKRGIASALIETSCAAFREQGWDHAMLGVDSENPTGAFGLYQRLGFHPLYTMVTHQLQV